MTMLGEELLTDVNGGRLQVGQKKPDETRSFVNMSRYEE
jgi:hypothetical protein